MRTHNWQFFLSGRHRRLSRLWQSFFAGWGLLFTMILIVSPFVFKNITWAILEAVDMDSIQANNLSMTNLKIRGTNKKGEPFSVAAVAAVQKFAEPGVIYFTRPVADMQRVKNRQIIKDNISAETGKFVGDKIILTGGVKILSSDGTSAKTSEMEIDLK